MKKFLRYLLVSLIIAVVFFILVDDFDFTPSIVLGLMLGLISFAFKTKEEKESEREYAKRQKEEAERQERQRKAEEEARNAPGCHSKDGVDILSFNSQNNLLTVGNNWLRFKLRNRKAYDVVVAVKYKYSYGWETRTHNFEVPGNQIRTIETSGEAWYKAQDISIVDVY